MVALVFLFSSYRYMQQKKKKRTITGMRLTRFFFVCCENCQELKWKTKIPTQELEKKTPKARQKMMNIKRRRRRRRRKKDVYKTRCPTIYYSPSLTHYNYIFAVLPCCVFCWHFCCCYSYFFFPSLRIGYFIFRRYATYILESHCLSYHNKAMKNWRNLIKLILRLCKEQPLVLLPLFVSVHIHFYI